MLTVLRMASPTRNFANDFAHAKCLYVTSQIAHVRNLAFCERLCARVRKFIFYVTKIAVSACANVYVTSPGNAKQNLYTVRYDIREYHLNCVNLFLNMTQNYFLQAYLF